jgi:hypothetical protein
MNLMDQIVPIRIAAPIINAKKNGAVTPETR